MTHLPLETKMAARKIHKIFLLSIFLDFLTGLDDIKSFSNVFVKFSTYFLIFSTVFLRFSFENVIRSNSSFLSYLGKLQLFTVTENTQMMLWRTFRKNLPSKLDERFKAPHEAAIKGWKSYGLRFPQDSPASSPQCFGVNRLLW